jgi:restriction endonuclease S subunit
MTNPHNDFAKVFTVIPGSKSKIKSSSYLESGKYAVVDQGKELVAGYTDTAPTVDDNALPVIVFGDHTRAVKYVDFPFTAGADGTKILKPSAITNPRYGFYLVLHAVSQIPSKGYARHFSELKKMQFLIPSLNVQKEIAEKLDSAFAEIDLLDDNLNLIDLLIAECDYSILEQISTPNESQLANHRSSTLGDVTELISRGISPSYSDIANIFVLNQRCIRNGSINLDFARRHNEKLKKVQVTKFLRDGDGLINSTGVGTLGRTALFKKNIIEKFTVDSHVTIVRPKLEVLDPDYFGLMLKALENIFVSLATGTSGQTELPRDAVRETSVTFPIDLSEQGDFYRYYSQISHTLGESKKLVDERRSLASDLRQSLLSSAFTNEEAVA